MVALADYHSVCICIGYFTVFLMILNNFYEIYANKQENISFGLDNLYKRAYHYACFQE